MQPLITGIKPFPVISGTMDMPITADTARAVRAAIDFVRGTCSFVVELGKLGSDGQFTDLGGLQVSVKITDDQINAWGTDNMVAFKAALSNIGIEPAE